MCPTTPGVYLLCLALSGDAGALPTVGDLVKQQGLPLFAAKQVRVEALHWVPRPGQWPALASRLVTVGFHRIDTAAEACKVSGEVLISCSEPVPGGAWGNLVLWLHAVGGDLARATPFLGREGPGGNVLWNRPDPAAAPPLSLTAPVELTLAFVNGQGEVYRSERRQVLELAHGTPRK
jgi:hypothetical protein